MHSDEDWNMAIDYKNYPDFPEPVLVVDGVKGLSAVDPEWLRIPAFRRGEYQALPSHFCAKLGPA